MYIYVHSTCVWSGVQLEYRLFWEHILTDADEIVDVNRKYGHKEIAWYSKTR